MLATATPGVEGTTSSAQQDANVRIGVALDRLVRNAFDDLVRDLTQRLAATRPILLDHVAEQMEMAAR
ncbi:hypothetical protein DMB38_21380 [Streptomyces sp. WAC 06738]|nr:hypothetical protein DMB38_21380 [Streptomyces sp. WAC 06738]